MKKFIFGLMLLVGAVLFELNYLDGIGSIATDKLTDKISKQSVAIDDTPLTPNKKPAEGKKTLVQQLNDTVASPLAKQITDNVVDPLNKSTTTPKPPIATIKIYDKKNGKEIIIETPTQLAAQGQSITTQQKDKDDKFKAYYKKSEKCQSLHNDDHEALVACGNEYIRAKAKFEELYQQEKLKN
jgi:hypothetical protein